MHEFFNLATRNRLTESLAQQTAQYLFGLRLSIHDKIRLQRVNSPLEAEELAISAKLLEKNRSNQGYGFRKQWGKSSQSFNNIPRRKEMVQQQEVSKGPEKKVEKKVDYPGVKDSPRNTTCFQNNNFHEKTNMYAKPCENMCYKCGSYGHPTGTCRGGKIVNLVEGVDDEETKDECDEDVTEEEGEKLALVIQRVLYSKPSDDNQRHQIFRSKCTIQDKVCQLVINGGSCENFIPRKVVEHF